MKNIIRRYSVSDVTMLLAAATVVENAMEHKALLQQMRPAWNDPFFDDLKITIDNITNGYLGIDNAKNLRTATVTVRGMQQQAHADLSALRVQIEEDFKNDVIQREEFLNRLGFSTYIKLVNKGNQEALVQMLYQLKLNLDTHMYAAIVDRGVDNRLLDRIISHADRLKQAEVNQENRKGLRPELTGETIRQLNDIFDQAMSICRIGATFLKGHPAAKNMFNFSKVVKNMGVKHQEPVAERPKPPTL